MLYKFYCVTIKTRYDHFGRNGQLMKPERRFFGVGIDAGPLDAYRYYLAERKKDYDYGGCYRRTSIDSFWAFDIPFNAHNKPLVMWEAEQDAKRLAMLEKDDYDFMFNPDNICNCECCPVNVGHISKRFDLRYPCDRQNCWVECNCHYLDEPLPF